MRHMTLRIVGSATAAVLAATVLAGQASAIPIDEVPLGENTSDYIYPAA